jgi:hypothetical protein
VCPIFTGNLVYIAQTASATIAFCHRLSIGSEALVGFGAPIDAAGELIIFLADWLVIHFFAPQMTAGELELRC